MYKGGRVAYGNQMPDNHTQPDSPWYRSNPAGWVLPSIWQKWTGGEFVRDAAAGWLLTTAAPEPYWLTEASLEEFLAALVSRERFDPDARGYLDRADLVLWFLKLVGPVVPSQPQEHRLGFGSTGQPLRLPVVARRVHVEDMFRELELLRLGVLLTEGLRNDSGSGTPELLHTNVAEVAEVIDRISSRYSHVLDLPDAALLRSLSAQDAVEHGWPSGDSGFALTWLASMATRWPSPLWIDARKKQREVVLIPEAPAQIVWLALAHTAGAMTWPGEKKLAIRLCARCGRRIVSSRPRNTGVRWFCDAPEPGNRSDCQNRFFAAKGREKRAGRKEGSAAAQRGKGETPRMPKSSERSERSSKDNG